VPGTTEQRAISGLIHYTLDDGRPLINSLRQQRTIARRVSVEGYGYWSGQDVRLEFRPAPPDRGIVFVRSDLEPPRAIPALVQHRLDVPRRTSLSVGLASVEMIEHVMAALAGLRIDNCEVWVDGAELPGCDGSSLPFIGVLDMAGIVAQDAVRPQLIVDEVLRVGDDDCWVEAQPHPSRGLSLYCRIDYGSAGPIGRQAYALEITPDSFRTELAPARTFLLEQEAVWLRNHGLGTRVTAHELLVFGPQGPIDNVLRFEDECVRHKALDLVGDLALAGCDLVGHFVAYCGGHRWNTELVQKLLDRGRMSAGFRKTA
jgi:UDP-3-O-[3-hydroxymyristoyl] N-acetylglucosamine deacetylase